MTGFIDQAFLKIDRNLIMASSPTQPATRHRYRIQFGKDGPLKYTSHLDLARVWERTLRRAGLPLAYSQGFNPRPKLQLAAALPLGYVGAAEILDVWFEGESQAPGAVRRAMLGATPEGLTVGSIEPVDLREPSLQVMTRRAAYEMVIGDPIDRAALEKRVSTLLDQPEIRRERRNKQYDLRPLIFELRVLPDAPLRLYAILSLSQEHGTGRADEVLLALDLEPASALVTRLAIIFEE